MVDRLKVVANELDKIADALHKLTLIEMQRAFDKMGE
jgi:hypothetical protein